MPKTLTINNIPFEYPVAGDPPGWGGDATGWAEQATNALSNLTGGTDILQTTFNVANNQVAAANITGLIFNTGLVRSAEIYYSIYRKSTLNPSGFTESGKINIAYDNAIGWSISQGNTTGIANVYFTILSSGQLQYTSSDIDGVGYLGEMKFIAKTLAQ
jgi:hypothetical protein